ncbi:hypothetical protein GGI05_006728, partial [Coemansia sp. RSA 2603]
MLNAVEFSSFVRLVKDSKRLNETQTIDALSTCLAQMLIYLRGPDELNVASGIVKMFGLVASGLADAPGTSMLYPVESVRDLVSGKAGSLSEELRRLLKTITSQKVWEPRSIAISKNRPVQIIIDDDDDMLAAIDDDDLSAMLDTFDDDVISGQPHVSKPASVPTVTKYTGASADVSEGISSLSVSDDSSKSSSSSSGSSTQHNKYAVDRDPGTGFWSSVGEVQQPTRRTQTSVDRWFGKSSGAGSQSDSLTTRLAQRKAETAAQRTTKSSGSLLAKSKKTGASSGSTSRISQMRSEFVKERQAVVGRTLRAPTSVPKQVVQAPRAMATVPVDAWAADRFGQTPEPPKPLYVRNASKAALAEIERDTSKPSRKYIDSGDSDISSSEDEDEEEDDDGGNAGRRISGLKGLIKINKTSSKPAPTRTIKMISMAGHIAPGKVGGGIFFDQQ